MEDDMDENPDNDNDDAMDEGDDDNEASQRRTSDSQDDLETQPLTVHPGEYPTTGAPNAPDAESQQPSQPQPPPSAEGSKPKKKKTKISYEEYETIANAIAIHLRSLESEEDDAVPHYLTWGEIVEWYLGQIEQTLGDSLEALQEARQKINLVIRRLVNVDNVLVTIGDPPRNKREEPRVRLAVHPNYVV
jgi:hypothetical protein